MHCMEPKRTREFDLRNQVNGGLFRVDAVSLYNAHVEESAFLLKLDTSRDDSR
jgi:hypothetical protein